MGEITLAQCPVLQGTLVPYNEHVWDDEWGLLDKNKEHWSDMDEEWVYRSVSINRGKRYDRVFETISFPTDVQVTDIIFPDGCPGKAYRRFRVEGISLCEPHHPYGMWKEVKEGRICVYHSYILEK